MEKTSNYNLNKPEATDPLRVSDFNENADIIDGALSNLNAAVGQIAVPQIAVGTYTGNNSTINPTTVEVGFAPKMVFIWRDWSDTSSSYKANYCGMAIQDQSLQNMLTLTETGFQVLNRDDNSGNQLYPCLNRTQSYFYFAIG